MTDTSEQKDTAEFSDQLLYTAAFSIIGFDRMLMAQPKQAVAALLSIDDAIAKVLDTRFKIKGQQYTVKDFVRVQHMNAKLQCFSTGNTNADLLSMLHFSGLFMGELISQHLLVTGALHYGRFVTHTQSNISAGKAQVMAGLDIELNQWAGITCDVSIKENLDEAILFTGDSSLFSKLSEPLLLEWQVPQIRQVFDGLSDTNRWVIDWPRLNLELFEKIRHYQMADFYYGYEHLYGSFEQLSKRETVIFENTLTFINNSLSNTVKLYNLSV